FIFCWALFLDSLQRCKTSLERLFNALVWTILRVATKGGKMDLNALLVALVIGAIAGWLAGQLVQGTGFGLLGDILIGILGAVFASWLFPTLGVHLGGGILASIIAATLGAVILLLIVRLIRRAT